MLPKPGRWMETFRKVMAVPMGLTALALLWLTWRLGGIWFALVAALVAACVVETVIVLGKRRAKGEPTRRALVANALVVVLLCSTLLPKSFHPSASSEEGVIPAEPFSETALAKARASGKPVFVWFTADWCLTCKVNEGVAIEREATRDAFRKAGVVALEGDWTRRDPEITRFLTAHGAAGVPLYLWYPAGGEAQQLPQVLTPDSLVELARQASRPAA
jgi:thiol:disulfide interchange protein